MPRRVQSPSSINTFKQCPRKYYYQYIEKLPTSPNIHTVRGNVAHSVLENFFDIDILEINMKNYGEKLKDVIQQLLVKEWVVLKQKFDGLGLPREKLIFYFEETLFMLFNWLEGFTNKVKSFEGLSFKEIFEKLTPIREQQFISMKYGVRGFIDAIENRDGKICIMDYKTSSKDVLSTAYRLQLAIYSLLYHEKHGVLPDKVGIYFLRQGEKYLPVDQKLVEVAKKEIAAIHEHTDSAHINDYNQKKSPLCKYSTGQCNFYELCFEQKSMNDFVKMKE